MTDDKSSPSTLLLNLRDKIKAVAAAHDLPYDGEMGPAMHACQNAGVDLDDFTMLHGDELVDELNALLMRDMARKDGGTAPPPKLDSDDPETLIRRLRIRGEHSIGVEPDKKLMLEAAAALEGAGHNINVLLEQRKAQRSSIEQPVAQVMRAMANDGKCGPVVWFRSALDFPDGTNLYAGAPPSAKDAELARLKEIEHLAWHLMDDSEEHAITGKVIISPQREDYDRLAALLPENHPEALLPTERVAHIESPADVDARTALAEVAPNQDEINRLRAIEHAAWHAWDSSEERTEGIYVPAQEAIALASLLPEAHPGNDGPEG